MNAFEQDAEEFRKRLCERATQIMEERAQELASGRKKRGGGNRIWGTREATRSTLSAEAANAAGAPLLTGWKEIAEAVGSVSTRTAQRWERRLGLPVGRVGKTPVADPEALREWKSNNLCMPATFPKKSAHGGD